MDPDQLRLADAIAMAARELHEPETTEAMLNRLVHVAKTTVPGADFAGVSLARRSSIETVASTGPVVDRLDRVQYELQEGPCLDAIRLGGAVAAADLRIDGRWPRFAPYAVKNGVLSQLGIEIFHDGSTVGGLNLYAETPNAFDETTQHAATIFAVPAGLALKKTMTVTGLTTALQSRQLIGQAVGITMQRYRVDERTAFGYLVRISQHSNIKLRDVARRIVDDLTAEAVRHRTAEPVLASGSATDTDGVGARRD